MESFKAIEGRNVVVDAKPGAVVDEAAQEAVYLSNALNCEVTLIFNDHHLMTVPDYPVEAVLEDWAELMGKP